MRRTPIIIGLLVATIAGTALWRTTHHDRTATQTTTSTTTSLTTQPAAGATTPPSTATPRPAGTTQPTAMAAGDRSPSGAVHAAIAFLELDEQLFPTATPARARALSDSITADVSKTRLGDRAEQHQREILAKGDLAGLVLRLAPISTRVRSHTVSRSTVDVFFLRLWSFPGKGAMDDYATAQIDLVWEHDAWRLWDSSVIDGPYPVARFAAHPVIASSASRFEATLAGFSDEDLHR